MPEQLSREQQLEIALRDMIRHYRNALESARSRIIEAHYGDESACDTVEQMTRHDPYIRNAEKALARGVAPSIESAARAVVRSALDAVEVHPCDHQDDEVRARSLSPEMRGLRNALGVPASDGQTSRTTGTDA